MITFQITIPDQIIKEDPDKMRFMMAIQLMVNRMAMSHFKYGIMRDKYPHSAHGLDNGKVRIARYEESGNTEACLDAANFLIIEHLFPAHPRAHFRSESSEESPGLIWREE